MESRNNQPPNTSQPLPTDLLEEAIFKASASFIKGTTYNNKILSKLYLQPLDESIYRDPLSFPFVSRSDPSYVKFNANRIPTTNFVAAGGPKHFLEMNKFLQNTVFHPEQPLHHIVALGSVLAYERDEYQDFYDYMLESRVEDFGCYHVHIQKLSGASEATLNGHQIYPLGIVRSKLSIEDRNEFRPKTTAVLNTTLIQLPDNEAIDLRDNAMFQMRQMRYTADEIKAMDTDIKKALSDIYELTEKNLVLFHCSGGVGRTGQLLLMLLILKHYEEIVSSHNPEIIAAKIHEQLALLRDHRLASVNTLEQFQLAIRNAHILYQYRLELKQENNLSIKPLVISPVSMFATTTVATFTPAPIPEQAPQPSAIAP